MLRPRLSCVLLLAGALLQNAQAAPPAAWFDALQQPIHQLLQQAAAGVIRQFPPDQALRTEIQIGQLNPALHVEPCQRIEPSLPGDKVPWGRMHILLRCLDSQTRWQIYVPVEVRFFGQVLLTQRAVIPGETLQAEDVRDEQTELSIYPLASARQMLYRLDQINQQVPTRTLAAGQPLRNEFLKQRPVIASGDGVRVLLQGEGFTLSAQGKALQAASDGQPIRVQIESGRIVTGTARSNRQVEVPL